MTNPCHTEWRKVESVSLCVYTDWIAFWVHFLCTSRTFFQYFLQSGSTGNNLSQFLFILVHLLCYYFEWWFSWTEAFGLTAVVFFPFEFLDYVTPLPFGLHCLRREISLLSYCGSFLNEEMLFFAASKICPLSVTLGIFTTMCLWVLSHLSSEFCCNS